MESYIFGIFPRSELLIEATRKHWKNLKELMYKETEKIIKLQESSKLSYISDPLLNWDDMLRPYTLNFEGIEVDGLNRFFETNTFYRVPVIKGEIRSSGKVTIENVHLQLLKSASTSLVVLPEPLTFALMCRDEFYGNFEKLLDSLTDALKEEAKTLREHFAILVLKAPYLAFLKNKELLGLSSVAVEAIKNAFQKEVILHVYFRNASNIIKQLIDFPVDGIGIDLYTTPLNSLKDYSFKHLTISVIDGYSTKMESTKEIKNMIRKALEILNYKKLRISNNVDLEYIPYSFAVRKVKILGKVSGDV